MSKLPFISCTHCPHSVSTASKRRFHSAPTTLSRSLCKHQTATLSLCMFKMIAAAWRSRRWYSPLTACKHRARGVAGDCTARTLAICTSFGRCRNAVRTSLWCDRAFKIKFRSAQRRFIFDK